MSATDGGALKYSVVLRTLHGFGEYLAADANVWEHPHEVLRAVAEAGYDAVDLDAEPDRIPHERFEEVRGIAHSLGLQTPALLAAWGRGHAGEARDLGSADEAQRAYAVSYAKKCVELAARVDRPVFEIAAVPGLSEEYMQPATLLHEARANFRRSVTELAAHAARHEVPVAIEPINRFEGYQGFMNSVAEAMALVDEIDSPWLGVMADCFHVNIEDRSVVDALTRAGRRLLHVHLADSTRYAPGTGHIDFLQVVRTLKSIDYRGYLALDCVPHLPDWKSSLSHSIAFMKQMERAYGFLP